EGEFCDLRNVLAEDGSVLRKSIHITKRRSPMEWDDIECSADVCSAIVHRKDGGEFDIEVGFIPAAQPIGRLKDHLRIVLLKQGKPGGYTYTVPINANVTSDL